MKEIVYSKTAQKVLIRMPRNWAIRIRDKISAYADDPAPQANNVKALQGINGSNSGGSSGPTAVDDGKAGKVGIRCSAIEDLRHVRHLDFDGAWRAQPKR
jgi:hypothetical protein